MMMINQLAHGLLACLLACLHEVEDGEDGRCSTYEVIELTDFSFHIRFIKDTILSEDFKRRGREVSKLERVEMGFESCAKLCKAILWCLQPGGRIWIVSYVSRNDWLSTSTIQTAQGVGRKEGTVA